MWNHLPIERLNIPSPLLMDPECSACRNIYDLQRMAAIKTIDRQIAKDHAGGYGSDVDALLERRSALMEYLRSGPHS
jgi:hypothetical protein